MICPQRRSARTLPSLGRSGGLAVEGLALMGISKYMLKCRHESDRVKENKNNDAETLAPERSSACRRSFERKAQKNSAAVSAVNAQGVVIWCSTPISSSHISMAM